MALMACATIGPAARRAGFRRRNWASLRASSRLAPMLSVTASCAGASVDLRAVIEKRFGVAYGLRAVANVLHRIGFSPISARPRHPAQDPETIATFKKTSLRRQAPTPGNCRNTRPSKSGFASRPFGSG